MNSSGREARRLWPGALLTAVLVVITWVGGLLMWRLVGEAAALWYVLGLGAVAVVHQVCRFLSSAVAKESHGPRRWQVGRGRSQVEDFRALLLGLHLSSLSEADALFRLGPVVKEIAAARLQAKHGVDLERECEKARALLGQSKLWRLVLPEEGGPSDPTTGGLSRGELEAVVQELENL